MARDSFVRMLRHTCTIRIATTSSDDLHGQPVLTWDDEDTEVACLWQERGGGKVGDAWIARLDFDGVLFIVYDIDIDETRRITNVQDPDGVVIEAGPLKVTYARSPGGQEHHLQLYCKRSDVLGIS